MDNEELVDAVTRIVMEHLAAEPAFPSVVAFGDVPDSILGTDLNRREGVSPSDAEGAQYIVLTRAAFLAFHGGPIPAGLFGSGAPIGTEAVPVEEACHADLSGKKVVCERDVRELNLSNGCVVTVSPNAIVTALARDCVMSRGARIQR